VILDVASLYVVAPAAKANEKGKSPEAISREIESGLFACWGFACLGSWWGARAPIKEASLKMMTNLRNRG